MNIELDYRAIGKRIKIARIRADLTQEHPAETVGVSPSHMSNIETGATRVSLTTLVTIANALSLTADDLLCDGIIKAREPFENEIFRIIKDCDEYEIRIIADMSQALKNTLRKDGQLRKRDTANHI